MRDVTIINGMANLRKLIAAIDDQTKTALAGEMLMQQAMREVLVKKGIFTDKELSNELSALIERTNKAVKEQQEKKVKELIKPTAEQAVKIDESKKETEIKPEKASTEKKIIQ